MSVTAACSTKDRYFTTLPLMIAAIAAQTAPPERFVLYDDGEQRDLRGVSPYCHLFPLLDRKGIQWEVVFGRRKGQVVNHQAALDAVRTDLVWRLDDDEVPEPQCLQELLRIMKDPSVGAVAGLVMDPKNAGLRPPSIRNRIEDIYGGQNCQWGPWEDPDPEDVDHLYSTFLFRVEAARKAGGYRMDLSPVGHREETIFSHSIKRAGYRLVVTPKAVTWHFREGSGGIRSYQDQSLWDHDERVFARVLAEWGVRTEESVRIVLDNGLGDHIVFRSVLPEILARSAGRRVVMAVCYPEVFDETKGVSICSIADAKQALGDLERWNVYRWADSHKWSGDLAGAFRAMYREIAP